MCLRWGSGTVVVVAVVCGVVVRKCYTIPMRRTFDYLAEIAVIVIIVIALCGFEWRRGSCRCFSSSRSTAKDACVGLTLDHGGRFAANTRGVPSI